jgi:hypothetical protein
MKTNPIFHFDATTDTGINEVPVGGIVYIKDSDGSGAPKQVQKIALGTLDGSSTIADFLGDGTLYNELPSGGIQNDTTGTTTTVAKVWSGTQSEYDNLTSYDSTTLYFIKN